MFSKPFITIPHSKDLFSMCMVMHLTVLFSYFYVKKHSLIFSDAVVEVSELWEAKPLDSLILINVVPGISVVVQSSGQC